MCEQPRVNMCLIYTVVPCNKQKVTRVGNTCMCCATLANPQTDQLQKPSRIWDTISIQYSNICIFFVYLSTKRIIKARTRNTNLTYLQSPALSDQTLKQLVVLQDGDYNNVREKKIFKCIFGCLSCLQTITTAYK